MRQSNRKLRVGIVGCGAIGSRIAKAIVNDLSDECVLTGLFDIQHLKSIQLAEKLNLKNVVKGKLDVLIKGCDCVIEAVNAENTRDIVIETIKAKKSILCMSVGKLLNAQDLFKMAKKNNCSILLPSGAIAGIDAIKAASLVKIDRITLTTRKPIKGFKSSPYFIQKGIDLNKIKKETVLFDGKVDEAVKFFPQNINVAATIALASQHKNKMRIKIITSPKFKTNTHEIEVKGDFGSLYTKTNNVVCPDNPKTSYLAVLSGIQTLKQFCTGLLIGT